MSFALPYENGSVSRWRRFMASPLTRSFAIVASFAALLMFGIQSSRDIANIFGSAVSRSAPVNGKMPGQGETATPAVPRVSVEPVTRFLDTRVGQLLFSMNDSDTCRRMLFNNLTGESIEVGRVECGLLTEAQNDALRQEQARERTQQVLKSFRR